MLRLLVAALAVACALAGCSSSDAPEPSPSAPTVTPTPRVGTAKAAYVELAALRLQERPPPQPTYSRDAFGDAWADIDGNGCNQRDDVLLRDAVPGTVRVAQQGGCDHDVLAGQWVDPYTGRTLRFDDLKDLHQAQAIQIDHVVPLAEAWVSGAAGWSSDRRRRYANDLAGLLAVDGPTNASKGAYDPAAWRPKKSFQCEYAIRWIGIKATWDLAVDESERNALTEMLGYC
jgi:hypothetical protein